MNETTTTTALGFGHFLAQADVVGKTLLAILVLMSAASWALIVVKGVTQMLRKRRSEKFLKLFWNARSLGEVQQEIATHGADNPFAHLTAHAVHAQAHHARYGASKLSEAGSEQDFLTRTIKKVLDEETTRLENGLTVLATVGATAPFVGLFGTVWGVYHALLAIGMSGAGTLDKVAGPVGEALIMTGIGLAVAIPAVMGYNAITRSNRVLGARLDAFAHELLTFLSTGTPLARGQSPKLAASETTSGANGTTIRAASGPGNGPANGPASGVNLADRTASGVANGATVRPLPSAGGPAANVPARGAAARA